ncbi:MAG: hypothetical protein WBC37_05805 [Burkholderiaceae bacterium]
MIGSDSEARDERRTAQPCRADVLLTQFAAGSVLDAQLSVYDDAGKQM